MGESTSSALFGCNTYAYMRSHSAEKPATIGFRAEAAQPSAGASPLQDIDSVLALRAILVDHLQNMLGAVAEMQLCVVR
jgi:hypothetical protein